MADMKNFLPETKEKIISGGYKITKGDAHKIYAWPDLEELKSAAGEIRERLCGKSIEPCGLINARQGKCSEDCKYCAQSRFWPAACQTKKMMEAGDALKIADQNFSAGVKRICVITSGRGLDGKDFEKALDIIRAIKEKHVSDFNVCASLGILDKKRLQKLKEAGASRVANNLETSERYFPKICSTHNYQEKIDYIKSVKEAGLELCSGGILGMGESVQDRIDFALAFSQIQPDSIPVNILSPVKGTPLESAPPLGEEGFYRTLALLRFANPKSQIRLAAGRSALLDKGREALLSGANALVSGGLLTLKGGDESSDLKMIKSLGGL